MPCYEADKKLPAFGIRELSGLSEQPGIIEISAPQYDATVKSQPDAALTYLDDDDGETITVGSGLELEQRLDEPVLRRSRNKARLHNDSRPISEDGVLMHLFDIQRTSGSLAVWRDHEAYSSKSFKSETSPSLRSDVVSASKPDLAPPVSLEEVSTSTIDSALNANQDAPSDASSTPLAADSESPADGAEKSHTAQADLLQEFDEVLKAACLGLETHLGGFGTFLESTSNALRMAAERTRDADTTPVESFLNGMKNILAEVGDLGLDLIRGLDTGASTSTPGTNTNLGTSQDPTDSSVSQPKTTSQPPATCRSLGKRVSFADMSELSKMQASPVSTNVMCGSLAHTSNSRTMKSDVTQNRNFPHEIDPVSNGSGSKDSLPTMSKSILDLETSDPDFSMRYPPLMYLRRAKTVNDLKGKISSSPGGLPLMNERSARSRFPSIGQLEDYRRPSSSRSIPIPSTAYEPKPQIRLMTNQPVYLFKEQSTDQVASPAKTYTTEELEYETSRMYRSPTVTSENEHEDLDADIGRIAEAPTRDDKDLSPSTRKPLPGSWPEPKAKDDAASLPNPSESSGSFFNRMTAGSGEGNKPRPASPALSCRNTSPPPDSFLPDTTLRRAQTVTTSNPAARLNRPFNPLPPAPPQIIGMQRGNEPPSSTPGAPSAAGVPRRSHTHHHHQPRYHNPGPTHFSAPRRPAWNSPPYSGPNPMYFTPTNPAYQSNGFQRFPSWPPVPSIPTQPPSFGVPVNQSNHFPANAHGEASLNPSAVAPSSQHRPSIVAPPAPSAITKVDECVKTLRQMGYGLHDAIEAARLNVYAGAAAGDVAEAVEMIEEDREAAEALKAGVVRTL